MMQQQRAAATAANGGYKGGMICYKCGGEDHRANECTNPPNPTLVQQKQGSVGRKPCNHCGGWCHEEAKCWNKAENVYLRPPHWRGAHFQPGYPKAPAPVNAEVGGAAIETMETKLSHSVFSHELFMANLDVNNPKLNMDLKEKYTVIAGSKQGQTISLSDPEIFIADTGSTSHCTGTDLCTTNVREAQSIDTVLGVSGKPSKASKIVDIPVRVMMKNGITDVRLRSRQAATAIYSVSQR